LKYHRTRTTAAAAIVKNMKFEDTMLPLKNRGTRVLNCLPLSLFCGPVIFDLVKCLFQYLMELVSNM
jgi:hypothetical protein